jgi:hypothetical protein
MRLGVHRLRGIPTAVPLFQVAAKGLPTRFLPPRTEVADSRPPDPR